MTDARTRRLLRWTAPLVLLAGAAVALAAFPAGTAAARQVRAKLADLQKLRAQSAERARVLAAVALFEALPSRRPVELRDLLGQMFPGVAIEVREQDTRPAAGGWTVRRVAVTLPDVRLGGVGRLIATAEGQRPPWRLVSCDIAAGPGSPGGGRAELVFEALEKPSPAS